MLIITSQHPDWLNSIHHDGSEKYVNLLYPALGDSVQVRLRTGTQAPIRRIFLRTAPDGEQNFSELLSAEIAGPVQWWQVNLRINQPRVHYRFVLESDSGVYWYSGLGPTCYDPLDLFDFKILADYLAPSWVHSSVFYQIFPDRFANGDRENDPQASEFQYQGYSPKTYPWGQAPDPKQPFPMVFYGGDLIGIQERLDYLQDLGINALYFNPIFQAYSNHKYDVRDYEHVDAHFGGDEALENLSQDLKKRRLRYILDVVPNHTGFWHPWFQQARQNRESPEADFYSFRKHPEEYATWLGIWMLPKLNYQSVELRNRIYGGHNALFRRWLRPPYEADGWRVDVANMLARQGPNQLGEQIAREIRSAVKSTVPSAYLIGENFFDATAQLQGDQWDGVMNYTGFTLPLWNWLRGYRQGAWGLKGQITGAGSWPTVSLETSWRSRMGVVPWVITLQQFNLLSSHDTSRIRTTVKGDRDLHFLAAVIQLTFPGVPCIYYGDEIGMDDDPNLESRGCMIWDQNRWDMQTLGTYRRLIHLRRSSPALIQGGFQILAIEEDTIIYQREAKHQRMLIVAHRSETPRKAGPLPVSHAGIPDGLIFNGYFCGQDIGVQEGNLWLPTQHLGAEIWIQEEEEKE